MLLDVLPEFSAWVFWVQLGQLAQNFLRALVVRHRDCGLDLHDLISARAFFRGRWNTLFAQPQFLTGLSSGRNLEHGAAIDGRDLNFGAERRFGDGDGDSQMNVVAFTMEDWMIPGAN